MSKSENKKLIQHVIEEWNKVNLKFYSLVQKTGGFVREFGTRQILWHYRSGGLDRGRDGYSHRLQHLPGRPSQGSTQEVGLVSL